MQVSCTFHFKGGKINISFLEKELKKQSLINQYRAKHCI